MKLLELLHSGQAVLLNAAQLLVALLSLPETRVRELIRQTA